MSNPLNVLSDNDTPWYADGLRFKCTGCGQCCTGAPGYVWVSEDEIVEMAAALNLSIENFSMRYVRKVGDRFSLIEDARNYDCIFLRNKKCTIYAARPKQCRTFPWWPQNLRSKEEWENAAAFCEGINHPEGDLHEISQIQDLKMPDECNS